MSRNKKPTISVVIPVYNDEKYISGCLDALDKQTIVPLEIIVVNNNCTDNSVNIAKSHGKVIVKRQKIQGLSHARNLGFDSARGDILVRIDADTQVPSNHIEKVQSIFTDHNVGAATGYAISRYELLPKTSLIWNWLYHAYVESFLGYKVLYGANMAFRRDYWKDIKGLVVNDDAAIHEDEDLSLALASVGVKVIVIPSLVVSVDTRSLQTYEKFDLYYQLLKNTKEIDRNHPRSESPHRLPKSSNYRRAYLWICSVWSIYTYYFFSLINSVYIKIFKKAF